MTGNTVLLGIGIASRLGYLPTSLGVAPPLIAIGAFVVGAVLTVLFMGEGFEGRRAAALVAVEGVVIGVAGIAFAFLTADYVVPLCIALVSLMMGAQSVAVSKARIAGISTTYVTGTLVTGVMKANSKEPKDHRDAALDGWVWITYLVGATAGAAMLIVFHHHALFPAALIFLGLAAWLAYENPSEK